LAEEAGGLEAFTALLQHFPTDTGMAFVLARHLDPARESALSDPLSRVTFLPVREVTNHRHVEPNHAYVIPPNSNLGFANSVLKLQPRQLTAGAHRSIDFFFELLTQDQREPRIAKYPYVAGRKQEVSLKSAPCEHVSK
jgi:two-component system, chemotaxis family, CheB/CheR fusion protein